MKFSVENSRSFFFLASLIAGFYAGRLYKTIKGSYWKRTAALVDISSERVESIDLIHLPRQQHSIHR